VFLRSQTYGQAKDRATALAAGAAGPKFRCPVKIPIGALSNTSFAAAAAAAVNWNQTGVRSFCSIEDDVPRYKVETATVPPTTYTGSSAVCVALTPLQ
jgi:hypothetical protein